VRRELGQRYDSCLRGYGPLNRFAVRRTGRTDPVTGEPVLARVAPPQGGFRGDPFAPLVYALEEFDPAEQRATKSAIFTRRVVAPRTPRLGADTAADALAICLDTNGEPRLTDIARLLGTTEDQARRELGTLVFDDPAPRRGLDRRDLCAAVPPRDPGRSKAHGRASGRPDLGDPRQRRQRPRVVDLGHRPVPGTATRPGDLRAAQDRGPRPDPLGRTLRASPPSP
jgi:hypothetical protein